MTPFSSAGDLLSQYQLSDEERKNLLLGNLLLGLGGGLMTNTRRGNMFGAAGSGAVQGAMLGQNAIADARKGKLDEFKMKMALQDVIRRQQFGDKLNGTGPEPQGPPSPPSSAPGLPQFRGGMPGIDTTPQQAPAQPQSIRAYLLSIGVPEASIAAVAASDNPQGEVAKLIEHYTKPEFGAGKLPMIRGPGGTWRTVVPEGANAALAAQTEAETKAAEGAKAQYDLVSVPQSDGTTKMMPRAAAVQALAPQQLPQLPQQPNVSLRMAPGTTLSAAQQSWIAQNGGAPALGQTANPLDMKRAEQGIATQGAQDTEVAKAQGQDYIKVLEAEKQAPATIGKLELLKSHLSKVETGKAAPTVQGLKAIAAYIAPDLAKSWTADVPYAQAAAALANEMALQLRNPSSGPGMPGSLSERDLEFLVGMTANASNDPRAIPMMIDARIALEKRNQEVGKLAREYRKANGGRIDDGFYTALAQYAEAHPMFAGQTQQQPAAATAAPNKAPLTPAETEELMRLRKQFGR